MLFISYHLLVVSTVVAYPTSEKVLSENSCIFLWLMFSFSSPLSSPWGKVK